MAYIDDLLRFSEGQEVTADAESTDVVDLGASNVDLGTGENIYLVVNISEVTGTSPTLDIDLQTSDDTAAANFADAGLKSPQITAAGTTILRLPVSLIDKRYLRLHYDVGGTSPDFTISDAYLTLDIDEYNSYPSGYKVTT